MTEHTIDFSFNARYYTLGKVGEARKVWIVLHGYGQLARFFSKKFEVLQNKGIAVIAPEGLSRFYLEDLSTRMQSGNMRVGANWMTRENRETDIRNYLNYLDSIYKLELAGKKDVEVTVLGFSQGAATASRWSIHSQSPLSRLILWAGIFPPDMDFDLAKNKLKDKNVVSVCGMNDPFLTDDKKTEMALLSEKLSISPTVIYFEGAHELHEPTLLELA